MREDLGEVILYVYEPTEAIHSLSLGKHEFPWLKPRCSAIHQLEHPVEELRVLGAQEILVYNLHIDICLERYPVEVLIHRETLGDIFKSAPLGVEVIHEVKLVDHRLHLLGRDVEVTYPTFLHH